MGLPPRVRGNRPRRTHLHPKHGSIPACAGEPSQPTRRHTSPTVYPRVCGGTVRTGHAAAGVEGLSPRVRGNPLEAAQVGTERGSIPACAGEPALVPSSSYQLVVYPRVCGGTGAYVDEVRALMGLSPRVRGNRDQAAYGDRQLGSIPACAGEPSSTTCDTCGKPVYPRVCGGTQRLRFRPGGCRGLSPRVRGNLEVRGDIAGQAGSIPACAGEPRGACTPGHPCGVYPRCWGGSPAHAGIDPRRPPDWEGVRGNPPSTSQSGGLLGSIPACAGEPPQHFPVWGSPRVYPRVCGGTPPALPSLGVS